MTEARDPFTDLLKLLSQLDQEPKMAPRPAPVNSDLDSAHHESGHTIIAWYSPFFSQIASVSIVNAGDLAGQVRAQSTDTGAAAQIYDYLVATLGGLAGALLLNKRVRSGFFEEDLVGARSLAEELALRHESYRLKHLGTGASARLDVSAMYRKPPSLRTRAFLNDALEEARDRLDKHREHFDRLVLALLRHRTLVTEDLLRILGPRPLSPT